ncbi:acyl carrier protein [Actinomadura atramentaria]|uniref:acyl carrier protein n=1 Tax=Actinomadura atramentaria TaxID=1990 RepID=UPI00036D9535|nr:acyl carrier protein [Actinomadura atramentaria]
MPMTYDAVVDGIRTGVRTVKDGARAGEAVSESTVFWPTAEPGRSSLSFDSLDFLELVVFLEETYDWYIPEEMLDYEECQTVADLAALMLRAHAEDRESHGV